MPSKRAILFMAWGQRYLADLERCLSESHLPDYPVFLMTDARTPVNHFKKRLNVIRCAFNLDGKMRKCEMVDYLPSGFDSWLFLDTDTRVLLDISLGFDKAELHGLAIAQATHYSLDHFHGFNEVMKKEGIKSRGELIYNTGVIFFSFPKAKPIFDKWKQLGEKYQNAKWSDQPYFSLAMELIQFSPYTLSTGYNHRAFGEIISGVIRIWHSRHKVPRNLNHLDPTWPRRFKNGCIIRHTIP